MSSPKWLKFLLAIILLISFILSCYFFVSRYVAKKELAELGIEFSGQSLLDAALKKDKSTVLLLIKAGVDVNAKGQNDLTALHISASQQDIGTLKILLKSSANVNAKTKNDLLTPLHLATRSFSNAKSSYDATELLLTFGADVNINSQYGPPLFMAAEKGQNEVVNLLLRHNSNLLIKDRRSNTALHALAKSQKPDSNLVDKFLEAGIEVNAKNDNDETALHIAMVDGYGFRNNRLTKPTDHPKKALIEKLIAHGADVNALSNKGTPLLSLVSSSADKYLVQLLLTNGADPNIQVKGQNTPLVAAAIHKDMPVIEMLLDAGANTEAQTMFYGTALHVAAWLGDIQIAETLIKRGANVNAEDCCNKYTVLHKASANTSSDAEKFILFLIQWGANVNAKDNSGTTPLMEARVAKLPVVQALVSNGANVNDIDGGGKSVLWWFKNRKNEAVDYLISKGAKD